MAEIIIKEDPHLGIKYAISDGVYQPAEDTYLLAKTSVDYVYGKSIIEIGSGTGIVSSYLALVNDIGAIAIDINPQAAICTYYTAKMNNANVTAVVGDGMGCIKPYKPVDAVIFNPPYLPWDEIVGKDYYLDLATVGGYFGYETALKWLYTAAKILRKDAIIIFITSSFTVNKTDEFLRKMDLKVIERRIQPVGDTFERIVAWVVTT